jgi:hypothetical protein
MWLLDIHSKYIENVSVGRAMKNLNDMAGIFF